MNDGFGCRAAKVETDLITAALHDAKLLDHNSAAWLHGQNIVAPGVVVTAMRRLMSDVT